MKRGLQRVLRVRALLEDLSRVELERRASERNRLLAVAERQQEARQAARGGALLRLAEGDSQWLVEMADADLLGWQRGKLLAAAEQRLPGVESARGEMLARRVERRQVETLLAEAAAAADEERKRREQKQVDDLFQSRRLREKANRARDELWRTASS